MKHCCINIFIAALFLGAKKKKKQLEITEKFMIKELV